MPVISPAFFFSQATAQITVGDSMNEQGLLSLLTFGVKKGASDIHLEAGYPPSYRIMGRLFAANTEPLKSADTELIVKLIAGDAALDTAKDADRGYGVPELSRFRATIFRQRGSFGLVLRVIPFEVPSLEQLNLPPAIARLLQAKQGLILVTGATGQGKSTTIAAMLDKISATEPLHIVTIEQPVEFLFPRRRSVVIQREVGVDVLSFKEGLHTVVRMDPDVIMVGELRDHETAETCLMAAETGHLVITTLHTQDVTRSIGRFVSLFPNDEQLGVRSRLADAVRGIVCLRLLPRLDGKGVVPGCELMLSTSAIQAAIRDPAKTRELPQLIEKGRADAGTQTFDQHLVALCQARVISPETAAGFATSRAEVERALTFGAA
jgi:twitching motility protein PilT